MSDGYSITYLREKNNGFHKKNQKGELLGDANEPKREPPGEMPGGSLLDEVYWES